MMKISRNPSLKAALFCLACASTGLIACGTNAIYNDTSATSNFGPGGSPVPRVIQVGFINNTPFRAIFTFGAYDQFDNEGVPTNTGQLRLEGNTASNQVPQPCRRSYSVGGAELVRLIELNEDDPQVVVTDPAALMPGVKFSSAPLGDPLEAEPTEGTALGVVQLVGIDYTCERTNIRQLTGTGLLIYTFEQDAAAPGGFRVDFMFVTP